VIFVTVGTHHLSFDRLLSFVDDLIKLKKIKEEVVIQSGTSTIRVTGAIQKATYDFNEFINLLKKARLVISHAGPATIYQSIVLAGKIPIVVPRLKKHGEHVSDHQLYFARELEKENKIYLSLSKKDLDQQLTNFKSQKVAWTKSTTINPRLKSFLDSI
jgi:UDP-N-acetylglucosamine transferase subunit ALG13